MSGYLEPDEIRADMIAGLGSDLGATFHQLQNELVWLHVKWQQYRVLYGTTEERIDLLNESAALFFRIIDEVLWDEILLHLCRLTDHPESRNGRRLSIRLLPGLIEDLKARGDVETFIELAKVKTGFARDWRNRRIAHRDLDHALNDQVRPLEPASRLAVEEALTALRAVLNAVNGRLRNTEMKFDYVDSVTGAETLLYLLKDGVKARDAKEQALRDGSLSPQDWIADHVV